MEEPKVNEKQKLVATFYCGEALGNAEKACVMAGYSRRYARGNAYKIVASSGVQQYIRYLNSLAMDTRIATIQEIQAYWSSVMWNQGEQTRDRLRASEMLAKAQGAFNDDW